MELGCWYFEKLRNIRKMGKTFRNADNRSAILRLTFAKH